MLEDRVRERIVSGVISGIYNRFLPLLPDLSVRNTLASSYEKPAVDQKCHWLLRCRVYFPLIKCILLEKHFLDSKNNH